MADGSYYDAQSANGTLDPWAVLGLHADDATITTTGIRLHVRQVVIRHVFERNQPHGDTHGPRVPRWVHVNQARDTIVANVATSRRQWAGLSVQTWNPFAVPGSPEALQPLGHRSGECLCSFARLLHASERSNSS